MAEHSGFFDAHLVNGEYDRTYLAKHFAKYFASFIGNGIFGGKSDELIVRQKDTPDMSINVYSGKAWIDGYWYENDDKFSLTIDVADGVLNRIDLIVLRWNNFDRKIYLAVKKGVAATVPVTPDIQRDADYYELALAKILIKPGVVKITQADITDLRLDSTVCGFVVALIQQFDTTAFGEQLNGYISNYAAEYKAFIETLKLEGTAELNELIDYLNALIQDESPFTALSLRVDGIDGKVALNTQTLGYTKKNLIVYPFKETTRTSYGITFTDNKDGTITANGTATADVYFDLYRGSVNFEPGKYIVSSEVDTSGRTTYIRFINKDGTYGSAVFGYNNVPFEITKEDISTKDILVGIIIRQGTVVSNVIFKPMLRDARILDATWEPYKLSVNEMIQEDETAKGCFYRMNRFTGLKEWLNAPTNPGIEYCLAERWNGKPVYQKTLYTATLPNNSVVGIEVDSAYTAIVSINGYALDTDNNFYHPFPVIVSGVTPIAVIAGFEGDGGDGGTVVIRTNTDATSFQAYITVKYTKT